MSKKPPSYLENLADFFLIAVMISYFIIANAYLGATAGWWGYEHAAIFAQGMLILLIVVTTMEALDRAIQHLHRRLNPPPPPPAKSPLLGGRRFEPRSSSSSPLLGRRRFEPRLSYSRPAGVRKAKDVDVSRARQDTPPSDLPF